MLCAPSISCSFSPRAEGADEILLRSAIRLRRSDSHRPDRNECEDTGMRISTITGIFRPSSPAAPGAALISIVIFGISYALYSCPGRVQHGRASCSVSRRSGCSFVCSKDQGHPDDVSVGEHHHDFLSRRRFLGGPLPGVMGAPTIFIFTTIVCTAPCAACGASAIFRVDADTMIITSVAAVFSRPSCVCRRTEEKD